MFAILNYADFMWYHVDRNKPNGISWVRNPTLAERFDDAEDTSIIIGTLMCLFDSQNYEHKLKCVEVSESGELSDSQVIAIAAGILRSISDDYIANRISQLHKLVK